MQFNLYTSIYFIWGCMLQWRLFVMTSCSSTTSCDVMLSDDLMCLEDTRDNVLSVEWSLEFQNNFIEVACAETIWVVSLISVCLHYNRLSLITGFNLAANTLILIFHVSFRFSPMYFRDGLEKIWSNRRKYKEDSVFKLHASNWLKLKQFFHRQTIQGIDVAPLGSRPPSGSSPSDILLKRLLEKLNPFTSGISFPFPKIYTLRE